MSPRSARRLAPILLAGVVALLAPPQARAQLGPRGPKPPAHAPAALAELLRQCPNVGDVFAAEREAGDTSWDALLSPDWWRSAAAQRTGDAVELRVQSVAGEHVRRVSLRTCSALGYSWAYEHAGGVQVPVFTGVSLLREGRHVPWSALAPGEQAELLKRMRARKAEAGEPSLVGGLFRSWVAQPAYAPMGVVLGKRVALEDAFMPRAEGRVFIPCVSALPGCDSARVGGALQLGTRLKRLKPLGQLEVYRVDVSPRAPVSSGRVHLPGERLLVCARERGHCAFPFESPTSLRFGPITLVEDLALRIPTHTGHVPQVRESVQLFDAATGLLYQLPGELSDEGSKTLLLAGDDALHVALFADGHGEVVDLSLLLASRAEAGSSPVTVSGLLDSGVGIGSVTLVALALLLAPDELARTAAQEALLEFFGTEAPASPALPVRRGQKARVQVSLRRHPPAVSLKPGSQLRAVGSWGKEVWALWDEDGDGVFDAVVSMPGQ